MGHYSEMDFLYSSYTNRTEITRQLDQTSDDNTRNVFDDSKWIVYKRNIPSDGGGPDDNYNNRGTNFIKNYLKTSVYKNDNNSTSNLNPYVQILTDFGKNEKRQDQTAGAGLIVKAADLAYLKDLGVYPINRMIILRRFPEGCFVPEDLNEMYLEPISTVIGWLKPEDTFGSIGFSESWGKTQERFDTLMAKILKERLGLDIEGLIPVPAFAQGLLFEFYKYAGITKGVNEETEEEWNYKNIPVGDPNMLMEGPYRDPSVQNIQSTFTFTFETTYEQKMLGDVDPGSAMLDIIDNLFAMGTSNMKFYWGESAIRDAKTALTGKANSPEAWWIFIDNFMDKFIEGLKGIFKDATNMIKKIVPGFSDLTGGGISGSTSITTGSPSFTEGEYTWYKSGNRWWRKDGDKQFWTEENDDKTGKLNANYKASAATKAEADKKEKDSGVLDVKVLENLFLSFAQTILTSTISIYRYELRGTIELMTGSKDSATPWYLTIGNPYSPWLATNHITVSSCNIETSSELGFNDQPQSLKATFTCGFSRVLGKQELLRMLNNTYRRTYSDPDKVRKTAAQERVAAGGSASDQSIDASDKEEFEKLHNQEEKASIANKNKISGGNAQSDYFTKDEAADYAKKYSIPESAKGSG